MNGQFWCANFKDEISLKRTGKDSVLQFVFLLLFVYVIVMSEIF